MSSRIEWVVGAEALRPWADAWNALAAAQQLPMLTWAWVDAYARTLLQHGAELHVALALDERDRLVGVLPLVVRRSGIGRLSVASAATPYSPHSAFGDLITDASHAPATAPSLLASACVRSGLHLREVTLRGVPATSPTLAPLRFAPPPRSACAIHPRGWGSFLPTASDWSAYRETLSKNFRANLRKAHNRIREAGTGAPEYLWLEGQDASPDHLETFLALEAGGWKGEAGSAIGQDATVRRFYTALCENAHRLGALEWHFMMFEGRAVAAHMAWRCERSLVLLKIAYDERLGRFSPGSLLFEATADRAFAHAATDEINCLTDMAWHRPWNMARREYFDLRVFPQSLIGITLGQTPSTLKRALKSVAEKSPRWREFRARLHKIAKE